MQSRPISRWLMYAFLNADANGVDDLVVLFLEDQLLDGRVDDHDFVDRHPALLQPLDQLLSYHRLEVVGQRLADGTVLVRRE